MSRIAQRGVVLSLFLGLVLPGTAQAGFFDQFFGGGPSQSFFGEQPAVRAPNYRPMHHYHPRKVAEEKPAVQTPTDLMHDKTLHYGDAVMTASGIKIFTGDRQSVHDTDDFTPLKDMRLKPKEKLALVEINAARTGQLLDAKSKPAEVVTGRSAAMTPESTKVVMVEGPAGKQIRYVGP